MVTEDIAARHAEEKRKFLIQIRNASQNKEIEGNKVIEYLTGSRWGFY
mgnify:CR=1 FL=1